jgi:hypothetical protein
MFGDMPLPAKFVIAFVIVLALIGVVAWLVRRFGTGALSASSARGRQARLGVIETTAVDSRRRLLLVRRDNVEHLIMLGGPTDLVVEANIVRAQGATAREGAAHRPVEPGWAAPADSGQWPGAPEPGVRTGRGPVLSPSVTDDLPLQPHPEPAPRVQPGERVPGFATEPPRSGAYREPPLRSPPVEPRRQPPAAPHADEGHAGDRHLAEMALQLEAALRRTGPAAPQRNGGSAEPQAPRRAVEPRFATESREPRSRLVERTLHSRPSAPFTPSRTKPASPSSAPADAGDNPAPAAAAMDAAEPVSGPPEVAAPEPPKEANEASEVREAQVESSEPTETNSASLEEEMANLLGRAPGKP